MLKVHDPDVKAPDSMIKLRAVVCPECDTDLPFQGINAPLFCPVCSNNLPDALDVLLDDVFRLSYHLDKGVYA